LVLDGSICLMVKIARNQAYGYYHLDPIPTEKELDEFYQHRYYTLVRAGQCAPEIERVLAGGSAAERETEWLHSTRYKDIHDLLRLHAPGQRVLEIGCGNGELLAYLAQHDFECMGVEPSQEAAALAREQGLVIHEHMPLGYFDAVCLTYVLEHTRDPVEMVRQCWARLAPSGIICALVPNDFTPIQHAAQETLGGEPWWVKSPEHVNYFDFVSLRHLLEKQGFGIIHEQGDFPMEMFLLMGADYTSGPATGILCHEARIRFEMALPPHVRRRIYCALGQAGVGRSCFMIGRKPC